MRDERTMDGAEDLVLAQIRAYGGFSVWWVEESAKMGTAILRLESSGTIRRTGGAYPFAEYEVVDHACGPSRTMSTGAAMGGGFRIAKKLVP